MAKVKKAKVVKLQKLTKLQVAERKLLDLQQEAQRFLGELRYRTVDMEMSFDVFPKNDQDNKGSASILRADHLFASIMTATGLGKAAIIGVRNATDPKQAKLVIQFVKNLDTAKLDSLSSAY